MATTATTAPSSSFGLTVVIPGQVIASSNQHSKDESQEGDFLRGHGTYIEQNDDDNDNENNKSSSIRLVASVAGTIQRVNKLVSVVPFSSSLYRPQVGDLVVGRIANVQPSRWKVELSTSSTAQLPLSAMHVQGGVQRVRTAQDARDMRQWLKEGDLVSAEVHDVRTNSGISLHTRSLRYGKLQNGFVTHVPASLIPRLPQHFLTMQLMPSLSHVDDTVEDKVTVLLGMNGSIWVQRAWPSNDDDGTSSNPTQQQSSSLLVEWQERQQQEHASTPVSRGTRNIMARLRNAIKCLSMVHCTVRPEYMERVYRASIEHEMRVGDMLRPENVLELTKSCRT